MGSSDPRRDSVRPTALITGASSGIGLELARIFAGDGYDVVLVARNEERLASLARELAAAGARALALPMDLADPQTPDRIFRELERRSISLDVLVNNAGWGLHGHFTDLPPDRQLEMIQVNVAAPTHLTRLALPAMLGRRRGRILNVSSTAAFQPGPLMAVYYATKAYVLSFSEAIANELRGTGVTVTTLCPGPTVTEFQKRAGIERTRLFTGLPMDAAAVARVGYDAMTRGRRLAIAGWQNWLLAQGTRIVPRSMSTAVARWLQETK